MPPLSRQEAGLLLACACLGFIVCLYPLSAAVVGGTFIPADADSFYHARRILDALDHPWRVAQFDTRIHAPEGSWAPVPWAYDTLMALLASAARALGATDLIRVLAFVAPLGAVLNVLLVHGIARQLGLGQAARLLAALGFALSPLTQSLHRVGMLDHHFVEQTFVLATLYGGLSWFGAPEDTRRAARLGLLLGVAPAFHAGLFILQLPILAGAALLWWRGRPLPASSSRAFALALAAATLLFLLPSQPFRGGLFTFTLQSWFHAYAAALTTLAFAFLARVPARATTAAGGLLASLLLALPLLHDIRTALGFLSGSTYGLAEISEMHGVLAYVHEGNLAFLNDSYTSTLWIAPFAIALLAWRAARAPADGRLILLAVAAVFGFGLLLLQYRLHYFGSVFLLLAPLWLADHLARTSSRPWLVMTVTALLLALAYVPASASLRRPPPPGGTVDYLLTRPLLMALHDICRQAPGVLLADANDGHYLGFHADCPTIASNIILSERDTQKLRLAGELMEGSIAQLRERAPWVRYVYVRRNDNVFASACGVDCPENRGLRQELLGDAPPRAPGLRLLIDLRIPLDDHRSTVLARVFALLPPRASTTTAH